MASFHGPEKWGLSWDHDHPESWLQRNSTNLRRFVAVNRARRFNSVGEGGTANGWDLRGVVIHQKTFKPYTGS